MTFAAATARLATPSLLLRPIGASDRHALATLLHRPEVRRYLLDDQTMPEREFDLQIAQSQARFVAGSLGMFVAGQRSAPETMIGIAGGIVAGAGNEPELIFALAPEFWGRGLAMEMAQAVIQFAFETLGWSSIKASVDAPNTRSAALLQRLGFEQIDNDVNHQSLVLRYCRIRNT